MEGLGDGMRGFKRVARGKEDEGGARREGIRSQERRG